MIISYYYQLVLIDHRPATYHSVNTFMINLIRLFPILILVFLASVTMAEDLLKPLDVINQEGQLVLSDGSSVFIFKKDRSFESGPHGLSGRTIKGTWKEHKSGGYLVEGKWDWINGLSQPNDFRTMVLHIGWISDEAQELNLQQYGKIRLRKAYFFIDSLQKVSK